MMSNYFRQYIPEYTVLFFLRYPIKRHVTKPMALNAKLCLSEVTWCLLQQ